MTKISKWNKEKEEQILTASDYMTYRFRCNESRLRRIDKKTSVTECAHTGKVCTASNCYKINRISIE